MLSVAHCFQSEDTYKPLRVCGKNVLAMCRVKIGDLNEETGLKMAAKPPYSSEEVGSPSSPLEFGLALWSLTNKMWYISHCPRLGLKRAKLPPSSVWNALLDVGCHVRNLTS